MSSRLIYPVEKYTPRTWRFIVLGAAAYLALVIVAWQVHTGWSIFFGIAGGHLFILCSLTGKPRRRYLEWTGILLLILLFFYGCLLPSVDRISPRGMDNHVKIVVSNWLDSFKEYAENHDGQYPFVAVLEFEENDPLSSMPVHNAYFFFKTGYLRYLDETNRTPEKPIDALAQHSYTGEYLTEVDLAALRDIHHVEITDPEHVGNFTYIPMLERDESGEVQCTGYTFVLYGLSMYSKNKYMNHIYGEDAWEHVIMVVDSDGNRIEYH